MVDQNNAEIRTDEERVSGGSKEGVVRWVLGIGLLLAIVALSIIWIVTSPAPLASSASRIASNIPASRHRANLRQTVFQLPKRSGRSCQVAPVRAIQKMPSRTCRLSIAGRHARPR